MANIKTGANQTVPGKQVLTDKKPVNNVLSSWEKRSSHIPILNDMAEVITSNETEEKATSHNENKLSDTPTKTASSPASRVHSEESGEQPVLRNAYCNSVKGKHVGRDQRQHQSLADAIEWPADASAVVDTTAIGYKVYQSPGPTRCSKLRVFRPKTAAAVADEAARPLPAERRPASCGLRGRRAESLQEMDLAIYWDAPSRPPSQRRASVEPEVGQLSRPPTAAAETGAKSSRSSVAEGSQPPVEGKPPANDAQPTPEPAADDSTRPSAAPAKCSARPKSAADSARRVPVLDLGAAAPPSERAGSCGRACGKRANRDAYKMAFKAGKLHSVEANEALLERLAKSRNLRVPKPKTPFAKKNYAIRTLTPPFSNWPLTSGYDYPDHWRLASVYQHAYKPPEGRKSPFMKTVFR